MFPDGYSHYTRSCRRAGKTPNKQLAKFATRYKMAGQLDSINLFDHSETSNGLYLHAMRITFAHTALECLQSFAGEKIPVKNLQVANTIRAMKSDKAKEFFLDEADSSLKKELRKFYNSKKDSNLNPICAIIRHSMCHGQFNPTASGLNNKAGIAILQSIEESIFKAMNDAARLIFQEEMDHLDA
jgi:hypothetical protein